MSARASAARYLNNCTQPDKLVSHSQYAGSTRSTEAHL